MSPAASTGNSYAGYLDLDVDITSRWLVSAAVRYEHFSDFGDTTKGKFATRYQVSSGFALRGALSSGFRAPSVGQSNLRRAATTFVDGRLVESLTLPPTNPVAVLKGGKPLQPEESVNWSLGAAFSLGAVDITLDLVSHRGGWPHRTHATEPERSGPGRPDRRQYRRRGDRDPP